MSAVRRWLVFHADDLGLSHGFNEAIRLAHRRGLVTSTCLNPLGVAYRAAIDDVLPTCPDLGVGVHVNLVELRPLRPAERVDRIVDRAGRLHGYGPLMRACGAWRVRAQLLDEAEAQVERVLADGVRPDHLNSHRHVHMLPWLFEPFCRLAERYDIPFVRVARERLHLPRTPRGACALLAEANFAKTLLLRALAWRTGDTLRRFGLRTSERFAGVSFTGHASVGSIVAALEANPAKGVEVLVHLCVRRHPGDAGIEPRSLRRYCDAAARDREMAAACSTALRDAIAQMGYCITSYRALACAAPDPEDDVVRPRDSGQRARRRRPAPTRLVAAQNGR
ncbi:MAG: ChbG/HpnK family deacetylase [Phycisphaerae bacterium]